MISGCHDVISAPSLDPMSDRARPSPNPSVPIPQKRPHGQPGHVGQIRRSDWLKFEMLQSDWLSAKPMPSTTDITCKPRFHTSSQIE